MVNVTLNGVAYQCAGCKEELTIGQYQRILKEWDIDQPDLLKRDYFKLFNILTNADFKILNPSVENEQAIWDCVSWVVTEPFQYSKELPTVLQIGDKILSLPKKIGALSIGQNIIMKQIIDNCRYLEESISLAVAVYLQPQYDRKANKWYEFWKEVSDAKISVQACKDMEQEILKLPACVVYPVGFFLLSRADQSGSKPQKIWHRMKSSLNSSLNRVLPKWLRSTSYGSMSV